MTTKFNVIMDQLKQKLYQKTKISLKPLYSQNQIPLSVKSAEKHFFFQLNYKGINGGTLVKEQRPIPAPDAQLVSFILAI